MARRGYEGKYPGDERPVVELDGIVWSVTTIPPKHKECVVLESLRNVDAELWYTDESVLPGSLLEVPRADLGGQV